jgi:hypothetical protein
MNFGRSVLTSFCLGVISSSTTSKQVCMRVLLKFNRCCQCSAAFDSQGLASYRSATEYLVAWSRPCKGIVCLNVDGSLLGAPQITGFGGVIRDYAELLSKKLWCCLTCKCVICKDSRCVAWV